MRYAVPVSRTKVVPHWLMSASGEVLQTLGLLMYACRARSFALQINTMKGRSMRLWTSGLWEL
jgi:hypothetical protein